MFGHLLSSQHQHQQPQAQPQPRQPQPQPHAHPQSQLQQQQHPQLQPQPHHPPLQPQQPHPQQAQPQQRPRWQQAQGEPLVRLIEAIRAREASWACLSCREQHNPSYYGTCLKCGVQRGVKVGGGGGGGGVVVVGPSCAPPQQGVLLPRPVPLRAPGGGGMERFLPVSLAHPFATVAGLPPPPPSSPCALPHEAPTHLPSSSSGVMAPPPHPPLLQPQPQPAITKGKFVTMCQNLLPGGEFFSLPPSTPVELVKRQWFDYRTQKWCGEKEDPIEVILDTKVLERGGMRVAIRILDMSRPKGCRACVAKYVQESMVDGVMERLKVADRAFTTRHIHQTDIMLQGACQNLANYYNAATNSKPVSFVDCWLIWRLGKDVPPHLRIMFVEPFLWGKFEKHIFNQGFVNTGAYRHTPSSLAHHSYCCSGGGLLVTDLQGVENLYTDPQIHARDPLKYGEGNLGPEGIEAFFANHVCTPICKALKLPPHPKQLQPRPTPPYAVGSPDLTGMGDPRQLRAIRDSITKGQEAAFGVSKERFNLAVDLFTEYSRKWRESLQVSIAEMKEMWKDGRVAAHFPDADLQYIFYHHEYELLLFQDFLQWCAGHRHCQWAEPLPTPPTPPTLPAPTSPPRRPSTSPSPSAAAAQSSTHDNAPLAS